MRLVRLGACVGMVLLAGGVRGQTAASADGTAKAEPGAWKVLYEENFEDAAPFGAGAPAWVPDTYQDTDEYSDGGAFYTRQGVTPPKAFRAEAPFGKDGWLTVAAYSRSEETTFSDLFEVVPDPADPKNHVLRVASPKHTDGLVIRPTNALPAKYRVCLRVGYANYGDGNPRGRNGYKGNETAEPWLKEDATVENGFY